MTDKKTGWEEYNPNTAKNLLPYLERDGKSSTKKIEKSKDPISSILPKTNLPKVRLRTYKEPTLTQNIKQGTSKIPKITNLIPKTKLSLIILIALIAITLGFLIFKPGITGYIVAGESFAYSQDLNLTIRESQEYTWELEQYPEIFILNSVKLSGKAIGDGSFKVYLKDDKGQQFLILDKDNLKATGLGSITGYFIANISEENITQEENVSEESNTTEIPILENVRFYKEEIPAIEFSNTCVETCSLFGLNQTSYTIVFELEEDVKLQIESIEYNIQELIKPKEIPEEITITFDRTIDCPGCTQNIVPPLTEISMTITVTSSTLTENAVLTEIYSSEFTVTDAAGAYASIHDEEHFRLEWNIDKITDSISKIYTIKSPNKKGDYYFQTKLNDQESKTWKISIEEEIVEEVNITEEIKEENITEEIGIAEEIAPSQYIIKDSKRNNVKAEIKIKDKDIEITFDKHPIKKIELRNVELTNDTTELIDVDDTPESGNFVEVYAIDPTNLNFTEATVTAIAKGTSLHKCKDWNFAEQTCEGEWIWLMGITPGQEYTFILTPEDPGLAEINGTFFEGFEAGNFTANNWTIRGIGVTNNWTITTAGGEIYAGLYAAKASDTDERTTIENNISTVGYKDINFNFYYRTLGLDATDEYFIDWYNGTDWINILNLSGAGSIAYTLSSNNLTPDADDNPDFKIRFVCDVNAGTEACSVDNILVNGTSTKAENTSLLGVKFDVLDFTFASSTYVPGTLVYFNTSAPNTDLILMTSMNVFKQTGGGTNEVWARIKVDNEIKLEEKLRTVQTAGADEGSTGTQPLKFNVSFGEHNISIEYLRTGNGAININDIDINLGKFRTVHDETMRGQLTNGTYTHSSLNFVPALNWTVNKTINSSTFYTIKQTIQGTASTAVVDYYFEDLIFNHTSPYWSRYLSSATDVGSVSGTYIDDEVGALNYTIQSRTTAGTITVGYALIDFDLKDNAGNIVNNFQISNNLTNLTNSTTYPAGLHNIVNKTVTVYNGTDYFLTMTSTFKSESGPQTPVYFINSSQVPELDCYSKKERYLSANDDIGNAFIYTICRNLTVGNNYTFNLWLQVPAGETVRQIDESLNGFEITGFSIAEGNLPPIPNEITSPANGSYQTRYKNVTWLEFTDPNGNFAYYNVTLRNPDYTLNTTINPNTTLLYTSINYSSFADVMYIMMVEGCDTTDLCSNSTSMFTVDNTKPSINLNYPPDNYNTSNTSIIFNWTAINSIDLVLDCNLTIDGIVNASNIPSLNATPTNYTVSGFSDGTHYWNVTCWDDVYNKNTSETRNFTIDTTGPTVTIVNPKSKTYNTVSLTLDVEFGEDAQSCWYNLNAGGNTTLTCGSTVNITANEGSNNVIVYANDSLGNIGSDAVWFSVDTNIVLAISIISPANGTITNDPTPSIDLLAVDYSFPTINYTFYIYNENGTLYSTGNSGTLNNNTLTTISLSPQLTLIGNSTTYKIIASANDSINYANSSDLYLILTAPVVYLVSPENNYKDNDGDINFTFRYKSQDFPTANCSLYINDIYNQSNQTTAANTETTFVITGIHEAQNQNWTVICAMDGISVEDTYIFHVDKTSPKWSNNKTSPASGIVYSPAQTYQFNITWTDIGVGVDTVQIEHNFTGILNNHTITTSNGDEYYYDYTDLAAGTYVWKEYANDSLGNSNITDQWTYVVNKATPACNLIFTPVSPSTYGTQVNASCSCTNQETSAVLYRNGTDVTLSENSIYTTLAAGDYAYVCNVSTTQNYTTASNSSTYTINKANHTIHLAINGTESDRSFVYPALTNVTGWLEILQGAINAVLYRNGSIVDSGSPATDIDTLGAGIYNYTYVYPESQNYTSQEVTRFLEINKSTTILTLTASPGWSAANGTQTNISCYANNNEVNTSLYRNTTYIGSSVAGTVSDVATLDVGNYNYTCNTTGSQNYTAAEESNILTITLKTPSYCYLTFDPVNGSVWPVDVTASCSCTNPETSAKLYRNGTDVTLTENGTATSLAAGDYAYVCNVSETGSYTSAENSSTYTINKASSVIDLTLNGNDADITIYSGSFVNITATLITPATGYIEIYNNGTLINSGTSPLNNYTQFSSVGLYNITAIYPKTQNYTASYETHLINVTPDTSPPVISLISPANDSYDIDGNVTFQYSVNDVLSGIANCSLIINSTINQTDSSITESITQEFNLSLAIGDYGWSINCTDDTINANTNASETRLLHVINCTDNDNDTYAIEGGACGAVDCDDNNSAVNPGATEVCDGVDNNCDGTIDEGCAPPPSDGGGAPSPPAEEEIPPEEEVIEPELVEEITPEGEIVIIPKFTEKQIQEIRRITKLDYTPIIQGISLGTGNLSISLTNTGNKTLKNLAFVVDQPTVEKEAELLHPRKVWGWDSLKLLGWRLVSHVRELRMLEWQVSEPKYYDVLRPGESIEVDLGITTPLTRLPFVDLTFKILSYGQIIYEETVPTEINATQFIVVSDIHNDSNIVDLYMLVSNMENEDKIYNVEFNINTAPDPEYKPTSATFGLFTSMFKGPRTIVADYYGPFKIKAKTTELFAYQYEYTDDFKKDYYLKYMLFEDDEKIKTAAGYLNLTKV